jgi:predicted RNA binding protein YcfA (HicA-like mRNA interferase family)
LIKRKEVWMTKKVKEVIVLLEENGWAFVRMRGDHRIYYKKGAKRPVVVPGNLNDDLKDGTLNSILKEAGLK